MSDPISDALRQAGGIPADGPPLTEEQLREVVRIAVRRVAERIAAGEADGPGAGGGVLPCALPPPGSPRYESVIRELERRA